MSGLYWYVFIYTVTTRLCVLSTKPARLDLNNHHFIPKTDQVSFAFQTYLDATLLEDAATFKSEFREEDQSEGGLMLGWFSVGFSVIENYKKNPILMGVPVTIT